MLRKILLGLLLFFLLLTIAVVGFRTQLTAYGLKLALEQQGARQVSVVVSRLDSTTFGLDRLAFVLPRGSRVLDLQLAGLTVEFVASELRDGRVRDISLDSLVLLQSLAPGEVETEPAAPINLPELLTRLTGDWQDLLPFDRATVANIRLCAPELPPALIQPLSLFVVRTVDGVTVESHPVKQSPSAPLVLSFEKHAESLTLEAVAQGAGEVRAGLTGGELDGAFAFDPAQLNSLLVLFGQKGVPLLDEVGPARMTGSFKAQLDSWPQLELQGRLAAENLTLADTRLKGLALQFDLALDGANNADPLRSGRVKLAANQITRPDLALDDVALVLTLEATEPGSYRLAEDSELKIAQLVSPQGRFEKAVLPVAGELSLAGDDGIMLRFAGHEPWTLTDLKSADFSVAGVNIKPSFVLHAQPAGGRVDFAPEFAVALDRFTAVETQIPSLAIRPQAKTALTYALADAFTWKLADSTWRIELAQLEHPQAQVQLKPLELNFARLSGRGATVQGRGSLTTARIDVAAPEGSSHLRNLAVDFTLADDAVSAEGHFLPGPFAQMLGFTARYGLQDQAARLHLETTTDLRLSSTQPLSSLLKPWPVAGDATAGQIGLTLNAAWTPQAGGTAEADIRLADIAGNWEETAFSGLALTQRLTLWPELASLDTAQVAVAQVDVGVPVSDIQARLRLRQLTTEPAVFAVDLEEGSFVTLGSLFSLTPFSYRSDAEDNRIRIEAGALDLANVVPLVKTEGLAVTGLVDAVLPLEVGPAGISMSNGTIRQKGPGTIIYKPGDREALKRAGLPEVVILALEDFRYDSLEVDAFYQPDGLLTLAVHLKGKSPSAGTERPIHINLNVEQNLLSLLRSLSYSETFDREIEKHIEKTQKK
ncbi:MAG: hypothetical protein C0622_05865 [Desulfuromonas sp.]|nr:MAG: hypothetical protein C0622_05865 [Desulfuromonas sp.]